MIKYIQVLIFCVPARCQVLYAKYIRHGDRSCPQKGTPSLKINISFLIGMITPVAKSSIFGT